MKKEEILKMNKKEIEELYKSMINSMINHLNCLDCFNCEDCFHCADCFNCSSCFHCSICLDCSNCSDCLDCLDCSNCSHCSHCLHCSFCAGLKNGKKHEYKICNIQFTKEEYFKKLEEIQKFRY